MQSTTIAQHAAYVRRKLSFGLIAAVLGPRSAVLSAVNEFRLGGMNREIVIVTDVAEAEFPFVISTRYLDPDARERMSFLSPNHQIMRLFTPVIFHRANPVDGAFVDDDMFVWRRYPFLRMPCKVCGRRVVHGLKQERVLGNVVHAHWPCAIFRGAE